VKGVLITFEGIEGCGKSTHIKLLHAYLKKKGKRVFLTREPGGTKIGDRIRQVLLDVKNEGMSPVTETLLYMASRAQLVEDVIKPKLEKGFIVLCDRWMDSTVAYQGYAGGVDARWIETLGRQATQGLSPAATLFLDLPVRDGLSRAKKRRAADRMERKAVPFHEAVRKGFMHIAKAEPRRFRRIVVDRNDSVAAVQAKVRGEVDRVL
jgi:dTMP kinase